LESERQRVENYLNSASENRLLGVVETEILEKRETVLLEKEGSGLRVLLANDKVIERACIFNYRLVPREDWPNGGDCR